MPAHTRQATLEVLQMTRLHTLCLALILCLTAAVAYADAKPVEDATPATIRVTGILHEDTNGDNVRDNGERGIPGVRVSNGIDIVTTSADGGFILTMPLADTRCIFPIIPEDYVVPGNVYVRIPYDARTDREVSIGLRKRTEPAPTRFSFVQITDIHVGIPDDLGAMTKDLAEINAMRPAPDFVFATGDLTNNGNQVSQYQGYVAATRTLAMPLVNIIGNHDYCDGAYGLKNWETYLGPPYFSFDYGGCHILCLESSHYEDRQKAWVEKDLSLVPTGKPIIVFQHHDPSRVLLDTLNRFNTIAIFSGHWHGTREAMEGKIANINTAPFRFGGIDHTARGFRVAYVDKGKISFDYRMGGIEKHLTVVSPMPCTKVPTGTLQIVVDAYDTARRVNGVRVGVRRTAAPDAPPVTIDLHPRGNWSWVGSIDAGAPGEKILDVTVRDDRDEEWHTSASYWVDEKVHADVRPDTDLPTFHGDNHGTGVVSTKLTPPLALAWVTYADGGFDLASPVVVHGKVYVGTLFTHRFDECGVTCLDAHTGEVLWRRPTDSAIKNSVCVDEDIVYAASIAGTVYALNAADGSVAWTKSLGRGRSRALGYDGPTRGCRVSVCG